MRPIGIPVFEGLIVTKYGILEIKCRTFILPHKNAECIIWYLDSMYCTLNISIKLLRVSV